MRIDLCSISSVKGGENLTAGAAESANAGPSAGFRQEIQHVSSELEGRQETSETVRKAPKQSQAELVNPLSILFNMAIASLSMPAPAGTPSVASAEDTPGAHLQGAAEASSTEAAPVPSGGSSASDDQPETTAATTGNPSLGLQISATGDAVPKGEISKTEGPAEQGVRATTRSELEHSEAGLGPVGVQLPRSENGAPREPMSDTLPSSLLQLPSSSQGTNPAQRAQSLPREIAPISSRAIIPPATEHEPDLSAAPVTPPPDNPLRMPLNWIDSRTTDADSQTTEPLRSPEPDRRETQGSLKDHAVPATASDSAEKKGLLQAVAPVISIEPAGDPNHPLNQMPAGMKRDGSPQEVCSAMVTGNPKEVPVQPQPPAPAAPRNDFFLQLAERFQIVVRNGTGEIRVQLKPEHLGQLEINAEAGVHGVIARIAAESGSVKSYLENNLHLLQQSFQEQGLKVERIDVVIQSGLDERNPAAQQHSDQNDPSGRHAHSAEVSASASRRETPSVEIEVDPWTFMYLSPNSTFHTTA